MRISGWLVEYETGAQEFIPMDEQEMQLDYWFDQCKNPDFWEAKTKRNGKKGLGDNVVGAISWKLVLPSRFVQTSGRPEVISVGDFS